MDENPTIPIDERIRTAVRGLTDEELQPLEKDILARGCISPLIIGIWPDGRALVDGHHRLDICRKHGLNFATTEQPFDSFEDALEWVYTVQLARRNLSIGERALIAAAMVDLRRGGDRKSGDFKTRAQDLKSPITIKRAAELAGIGHASVDYARTVLAAGDEDLIDSVKSGEKTIRGAATEVKKRSAPAKTSTTKATKKEKQVGSRGLRPVDPRKVVREAASALRVMSGALADVGRFDELDEELLSWCGEIAKYLGTIRRFLNQNKLKEAA